MKKENTQLIETIHQKLVIELETIGKTWGLINSEIVLVSLNKILDNLEIKIEENSREEIIKSILARVTGLGQLQSLIDDKTITEIMVNGYQNVFIERTGKIEKMAIEFSNDNELLHLINRIVSRVGRHIDTASPLVDARLPDGSRVHAIIPPLSLIGPVLNIRKFGDDIFNLEKLVEINTLNQAMANFLKLVITTKQNILISGGTGSGKTSTLNALASTIPDDERVIIIEDIQEIRLNHNHIVSLESRLPNIEGKGEINIRTLLRTALRMRPDRIIVGEIRGAEALDMLQSMNTGHQGSLSTVHSNSSLDALFRLETMTLMSELDLPLMAIREQIKSAIQFLIQVERLADGSRKITSISELENERDQNTTSYKLNPIFFYDKQKKEFVATGYIPQRKEAVELVSRL